MKPKILLLDEPHPKARAIMEEVAEVTKGNGWTNTYEGIYTGLTCVDTKDYPCLKFIGCPCTGIDHITNRSNVPIIHLDEHWKANEGREITSTAEHTWSLILQLAKMNRMQLKGKTLHIIGYGRVGQQVAKYAEAFNMTVAFRDKGIDNKWLSISDIITLHVPLDDSTRGMIGEKEFAMMELGALLVNTSRAEIVDHDALLTALCQNKISYASDFYDSRYEGLGNVIQTPHIGGNCLEARKATDVYIANKIVEFINQPKFTFEYDGL